MVNRYSGQIQKRIGDAGVIFVSSDCRSKYKGKCKAMAQNYQWTIALCGNAALKLLEL